MTTLQVFVKQNMSPKYLYNNRWKRQKCILENCFKLMIIIRLTSFQKPQLLSVSIFLKFVHPCLFLYFLCRLYLLLTFQRVRQCFTQFGGNSLCLNFWPISWHEYHELMSVLRLLLRVFTNNASYLACVTERNLVTLSLRFCSWDSPLRLPI